MSATVPSTKRPCPMGNLTGEADDLPPRLRKALESTLQILDLNRGRGDSDRHVGW